MASLGVILLIVVFPILIIFRVLSKNKRYSCMPPGPSPLPYFGNTISLLLNGQPTCKTLAEWSKKYGDAMTVWFFSKPVVILSSLDIVRKVYIDKQHDFASRSDSFISMAFFGGYDRDVIFGRYTPKWQFKRKLVHQCIRQIVTTPRFETETVTAIEQIGDEMVKQSSQEPVDMQHYIIMIIYNMVMILVFGKRYNFDDPEFLKFFELHNFDNEAISAVRFYDAFPFLKSFPIFKMFPTWIKMKGVIGMYNRYLLRWYNDTIVNGDIEYVTQAILKNIQSSKAKNQNKAESNGVTDENNEILNEEDIAPLLLDLYLASTSTTSSAISWLFLEMVLHPEIQQKCLDHIHQVIGDRPVNLNDRHNLPYIEACILEALRFHSPVSLNVPHCAVGESDKGSYKIPETDTIMNIWALHHDPKLWKDAGNFNPENFLDSEGRLVRPPHMMPFGAGRRVCVGEAFAKNSMFLVFALLIQRLRFESAPGRVYSLEPADVSGEFINVAKQYEISIRPR